MLLKSLKLQGFKTFPDQTKLSFGPGITAVVGPNGSGKSNISDAIRWVLGEQSCKTLRCSRMEDVIFNGTPARKSQGYAQVTLTIDNRDRRLPFGEDEVAITRRYYRSGDSEYLINKAVVRLKDIHELFMDTGLGRDGYSIIGQGKIDSIVASRSEDRREIFEEAAGISRYRYRKGEAEKRLNQTEENLLGVYALDPLIPLYAALNIFMIHYFYKTDPLRISEAQISSEDAVNILARRAMLSDREKEVLTLVNKGLGNKQIAAELSISENTVKRHMSNIFKKTETQSRHELLYKISTANQYNKQI